MKAMLMILAVILVAWVYALTVELKRLQAQLRAVKRTLWNAEGEL